ncbi:MAG: hypothetical protein IH624_16015 [Phycisphaerae bacterium]|nr:hypothetical protein [Phycisphaerae bacterium]
MNCPECQRQTPDASATCESCGHRFTAAPPRTSRAAIAAFVLGLLPLSPLVAIGVLIVGLIALRNIRRSRGALKGRGWAIAGMTFCCISVVLVGAFWAWSLDAEPITDDYTIADLKYPGPEYDQTWDLLKQLAQARDASGGEDWVQDAQESISAFFKDFNDPNQTIAATLSSHAATGERLWQDSMPAREIIRQLSGFEHISDLSDPVFCAGSDHQKDIRYLGGLYAMQAILEAARGNDVSASQTLIEMSTVNRKLSTTSRPLLTKLICFSNLGMDFQAAVFILNAPSTSPAALDLLRKHYAPLAEDQLCFTNCLIFEYLAEKRAWLDMLAQQSSALALIAKPNSTLRVLRNCYDAQIARHRNRQFEALPVYPHGYPYQPYAPDDPLLERGGFYQVYNPFGWLFLCFTAPTTDHVLRQSERFAVTDDLFQIILAMRLGEDYSLESRIPGQEYVIDMDRKIIYSPGPDGEPFTWDDIKLPINPEVLQQTAGR